MNTPAIDWLEQLGGVARLWLEMHRRQMLEVGLWITLAVVGLVAFVVVSAHAAARREDQREERERADLDARMIAAQKWARSNPGIDPLTGEPRA